MKTLGRELVEPFGRFWELYGEETGIAWELVEEGHSAVFGALGADLTAPALPQWTRLPDDDLAYHATHELAHVLLRRRGFPHTARGRGYGPLTAEARIGGDIEEMVIHPALDALIMPLGFSKRSIQARMLRGALNGVRHNPPPASGTPWFYTWAIRYCELKLDLPPQDWRPLARLYEARSLAVCELGRDLLGIMHSVGWGTREQALRAMVEVRDTLGLSVDDRVLVIDPETGERH